MFYKVATTASTCSLATVAWRVNINLLLIISTCRNSSSNNFSSRDQARAADGWSSDSDAGASAPRPLESALVGKRSSLRVHIQKQRDTVCSSSSATHLPWQSIWQRNTHPAWTRLWRCQAVACVGKVRVVRATTKITQVECLSSECTLSGREDTSVWYLHTAMVLNRRQRDVIGRAVRNSERLAKQKDEQQGGQ